MSSAVTCIFPFAVASQETQHCEILARDRTADFQPSDGVNISEDTTHILCLTIAIEDPLCAQPQFLSHLTISGGGNLDEIAFILVGTAHDMVGIFSPLGTIAFGQGLWHENLERCRQVAQRTLFHRRNTVAVDIDAVQAGTSAEGVIAHLSQRVGQHRAAQLVATGKGSSKRSEFVEGTQLVEGLYIAAFEDTVDAAQLEIL